MSRGQSNKLFLRAIDAQTNNEILIHISNHYGISASQVFEEVTDKDAESLLDYLLEPCRSATSISMQRHGFR